MKHKKLIGFIVELLLVWVGIFLILSHAGNIRQLFLRTGLVNEEIYIAGTGSMYPTFPKGEAQSDVVRAKETVAWPKMKPYPRGFLLLGKELFGYKIKKGDIVSFSNKKTDEITQSHYGKSSGFVKRVIALPGDLIEIRDGYVSINGKTLDEPYTAKPRSTYGGEFLSDCQTLKIPNGKVFVMGDNRKESLDSRNDLGFIDFSDIDHVIPFEDQREFESKWRDTSNDLKEAGKPSLDIATYLDLLNKKRIEAKIKPLSYNEKLALSAQIRGKVILEYNDLSFEATRSGYTMQKALSDVGYSNIVRGETPVLGFYDAQELIDNFFAFPQTKKFLLNPEYQETGMAVVVGKINDCPTQIIVEHLAGYVAPNYDQKLIDSWKKLLSSLQDILPSWERAKENSAFYDKNRQNLDRLLYVIKLRIDHSKAIVDRMEKNQWLTDEEEKFAKDDGKLDEEQGKLAQELNNSQ